MTEKTPVKLIVSDVDNTISDFFNVWGLTSEKGIKALAESRGIEKDVLYANVRDNTSGYARFHSFPDVIKEAPMLSLEGKSPEERARLEKGDAEIAHQIEKERHEGNKLYDGVIATIRKAKAAGTQFVLYTDSPVNGVIVRMADMGFPLDLLDGMVCRADHTVEEKDGKYEFKKAPMQVAGSKYDKYRDEMVAKLGDKLVMNPDGCWKPNMDVMQGIMDRHNAKPSETVMVGDNIKSDGGAVKLGCHFAWQKEGSEVVPEVKAMYRKLNEQQGYSVGAQAHLDQLADMSAKDPALGKMYKDKMVTLEGGFKDLNKYFRFTSQEKAKEQTNMAVKAAVVRRAGRGGM